MSAVTPNMAWLKDWINCQCKTIINVLKNIRLDVKKSGFLVMSEETCPYEPECCTSKEMVRW